MPASRDVLILLVVYGLAGSYSLTVYSWFALTDRVSEDAIPIRERLGLSVVLGVLLLAVVNNYLSAFIGSKATAIVVLLIPLCDLVIVAARQEHRSQLIEALKSALPRATASAAVCAVFILACLHKLFTSASLSNAGILYADLPYHIGRAVEQAFQSSPGFWPRSPMAFPDALPFQSFVADSLASATFRYLPGQLHALTYAQVLFGWAMVLWSAVVLIAASGPATSLIVLATTMLCVPLAVLGFDLPGWGYTAFVFFHANPNSLVGWPVALAFVFHLHQSFRRRTEPLWSFLVLVPPASIFFKANLAFSFAFLQAVGLVAWGLPRRHAGFVKRVLYAAAMWMVAIALARVVGRSPVSTAIHPSVKNLWAYADVAIPSLGKLHSGGDLFATGLSYLLMVTSVTAVAAWWRTRHNRTAHKAMLRGVIVPVGVLVAAMAYVLVGWWFIVPIGPPGSEGEPMHVNFELIVWLMSVPIAASLCSVYDEGAAVARLWLVGVAVALACFMGWVFNTQTLEPGGLAIRFDYSVALEKRLRDALKARIPDGHCFAYGRRYVIYTDEDGEFPPDFAIAATGCPVLNGRRWRGYLGANDAEALLRFDEIGVAGRQFHVVDMSPCQDRPSRPTGFAATVQGATARLSWIGVDRATAYRIEVGSKSGLANLQTLAVTSGTTGLGVSSGKSGTYFMRVRAKNGCGVSSASEEIRVDFP